jgi:hypothetical protein
MFKLKGMCAHLALTSQKISIISCVPLASLPSKVQRKREREREREKRRRTDSDDLIIGIAC